MKYFVVLFSVALLVALSSCKTNPPSQPQQAPSNIVVNVNWQNQGVAGVKIVVVETAETLYTNSGGIAVFTVPVGHYTVRAFGINRGGPSLRSIDYNVEVLSGKTAMVDVLDCLPCV